MVIEVRNISKSIKGKSILSDVSLRMEGGHVYGIIGRNGSGKTMLFRAVSGLMQVDAGEVYCDGKKLHKDIAVLPNLGIVLENADLYPEYNSVKNLQIFARINNVIGDAEIVDAIKRVGLDPNDKRSYRKYSLGMKQRLKLAQAIMERPDVIILDEPTNSLDEEAVAMLHQIIVEEKERGALIMLASHIKSDIMALSDEVFTMVEGALSRQEVQHA